MELYNDRLCLTGEEVWAVLGSNFNTLLSRGRVKNLLGRACYNRSALYDVDDFPNNKKNKYRDELYSAYPELSDWKKIQEHKEYRHALIDNMVPDAGAKKFFSEYSKPNGQPLTAEEREKYENSVKVLNAMRRVWERSYSRHAASGTVSKIRKGDFFRKMSAAMPEVVARYPLSFSRFNWSRLQELYEAYGDNNYAVLITGKTGNQNRTKKQKTLIEQIILSIYYSSDKPFVADVHKWYNEFLLGQLEIYNEESGEVYNRADFIHKGEPITVSEAYVWGVINNPLNRKVVDRGRNDFHYNQNKHNASVVRKSPEFSMSKITFDDRDLRRKAIIQVENKVTGKIEEKEVWAHAYYAFDVASGTCIGSAYSLKKDTNLIAECMRDMWANLRRWNLLSPYEFEVENHLIKGTDLEQKFLNSCTKLRFCAPMNSREKRAEHLIKDKVWYSEDSEIKRGLAKGRHNAKHEAYSFKREKVFDELNDTYKNQLEPLDFALLVEEDRKQMAAWNNRKHNRKKDKKKNELFYPGMTCFEVLLHKQNTRRCTALNWRLICKEWGIARDTSVKQGRSATVDYREWWLSSADVITRFAPNNTGCSAYFIPEYKYKADAFIGQIGGEKEIREIYLYQGERYIDCPKDIGEWNEAAAERTDADNAVMHEQLGWISHHKKLAKERKEEVIVGKIGMMKTQQVDAAIYQAKSIEIIEIPPPIGAEPSPELVEEYADYDLEDYVAKALNAM